MPPVDDQAKTYRVNTGKVTFVPFTANSIQEAIEYVRRNQNAHYAGRRWPRVKAKMFAWLD